MTQPYKDRPNKTGIPRVLSDLEFGSFEESRSKPGTPGKIILNADGTDITSRVEDLLEQLLVELQRIRLGMSIAVSTDLSDEEGTEAQLN